MTGGRVLSVVSAIVDLQREDDLTAAYFELITEEALPPGLILTLLLKGASGEWKIHSLWRNREALDRMRGALGPGEVPGVVWVFNQAGVDPQVDIFDVHYFAYVV
jgi:hypothetical protein